MGNTMNPIITLIALLSFTREKTINNYFFTIMKLIQTPYRFY